MMIKIRRLAACGLMATALLSTVVPAQEITPRADLTTIKTSQGELVLLHTSVVMNNAHDVDVFGFFKRSASGPGEHIPFKREQGFEPYLTTRTGADCMVAAVRVRRDADRLQVVYASRKGEWLDKQAVTLQLFELTADDSDAPGIPALYFKLKKKVDTRSRYCDVNEAVDKEAAVLMAGPAMRGFSH